MPALNPACIFQVSKLPFTRLSSLHTALQLLRRQHCFNHLFQSCFRHPSATLTQPQETSGEESEVPVIGFELLADPEEMWLQVTTVHPGSRKLLTVQITVGAGGEIEAEVQVMKGTAAFRETDLLLKVLRVSMDIPLAIDAAFPAAAAV